MPDSKKDAKGVNWKRHASGRLQKTGRQEKCTGWE